MKKLAQIYTVANYGLNPGVWYLLCSFHKALDAMDKKHLHAFARGGRCSWGYSWVKLSLSPVSARQRLLRGEVLSQSYIPFWANWWNTGFLSTQTQHKFPLAAEDLGLLWGQINKISGSLTTFSWLIPVPSSLNTILELRTISISEAANTIKITISNFKQWLSK